MGPLFEPLGVLPAAGKKGESREPDDHALGRSRGGFSTKIHLLCDQVGHPLYFCLTPGQTSEYKAFDTLLEGADEVLYEANGEPLAWPVALAGDIGLGQTCRREYLVFGAARVAFDERPLVA